MNRITRFEKRLNSRGFTIIELMITLVITSVLILGSVNFLVSARRSNNLQSALSELNGTGRFGIDQITRDLRMSGYRATNWTLGPIENHVSSTNRDSADGGDTLSVSYEGARTCSFARPAGYDTDTGVGDVFNTYQVVNGALECNGQVVANGIEEMQVYFGEDLDADTVANRWVEPNTAGLDMTRVIAVRLHLLVRTDGNNLAAVAAPFRFDNAMRDAIDDGQIRREFSVTVALRNPI